MAGSLSFTIAVGAGAPGAVGHRTLETCGKDRIERLQKQIWTELPLTQSHPVLVISSMPANIEENKYAARGKRLSTINTSLNACVHFGFLCYAACSRSTHRSI